MFIVNQDITYYCVLLHKINSEKKKKGLNKIGALSCTIILNSRKIPLYPSITSGPCFDYYDIVPTKVFGKKKTI